MKETTRYLSADSIVFAADLAERILALKAEEKRIWRKMADESPSPEEMAELIYAKHAIQIELSLLQRGPAKPPLN